MPRIEIVNGGEVRRIDSVDPVIVGRWFWEVCKDFAAYTARKDPDFIILRVRPMHAYEDTALNRYGYSRDWSSDSRLRNEVWLTKDGVPRTPYELAQILIGEMQAIAKMFKNETVEPKRKPLGDA